MNNATRDLHSLYTNNMNMNVSVEILISYPITQMIMDKEEIPNNLAIQMIEKQNEYLQIIKEEQLDKLEITEEALSFNNKLLSVLYQQVSNQLNIEKQND